MSSTTLAPDLQVPSGQDVFTTNDPLATQTPFGFISSSFGDVNSWTVDMEPGNEENETMSSGSEALQHEDLFDEFLDTVQRSLENIATFVEPPFNREALVPAIITILTLFKSEL
nr:hypothetical protein FVER53263_20152 [Fusarium verticillioides]